MPFLRFLFLVADLIKLFLHGRILAGKFLDRNVLRFVVGQAQTERSKEYYLISIAAASRMGQSDFGKNSQHIEGIVRALALKK